VVQSRTGRRRTTVLIAAGVVVAVLLACGIVVYLIRQGHLTQTSRSPDNRWEVRVYQVAAPATDRDVIRATASLRGAREREVLATDRLERVDFEDEREGTLHIRWLGGDRASIGGYVVDLAHDHIQDF
jgi:hypothetical protein